MRAASTLKSPTIARPLCGGPVDSPVGVASTAPPSLRTIALIFSSMVRAPSGMRLHQSVVYTCIRLFPATGRDPCRNNRLARHQAACWSRGAHRGIRRSRWPRAVSAIPRSRSARLASSSRTERAPSLSCSLRSRCASRESSSSRCAPSCAPRTAGWSGL